MWLKSVFEDIQRRVRWIPSWKKKKIARIFKTSCVVLLAAAIVGGGFLALRRFLPKSELAFPEEFHLASFRSESNENQTDTLSVADLTPIQIATAEASSSLSGNKASYSPDKAYDGDLQTSWQEGASGYGIGESITCTFDKSQPISCIVIYGGSFRSQELFRENGRLKRFTVTFSDGTYYSYDMEDSFEPGLVYFETPVITKSVSLRIDEVYAGTKYEDTVISEISFLKK